MDSKISSPENLLALARSGDRLSLGQLLELYRGYLSLVATNPRCPTHRPDAPLPRQPAPGCPARARTGCGTGAVVAGPRRRTACQTGLPQPAGRSARTGPAARRCLVPPPGGLPRGPDLATHGRPDLPGGRAAPGTDPRRREIGLDACPRPPASLTERCAMSEKASPALIPADTPSPTDDPRMTQALEDHLAALEAGDRPDREQLRSRYPEIADELSGYLDGLEILHQTVAQMRASSCAAAGKSDR